MANFLVWCVWVVAAFACVASALGVVTFRNPFFSALALIGNLASLAVLYLLLGGEFVAAGQVLVYGGAVMVMFLFVIAYLGDKTERGAVGGRAVVAARRDRASPAGAILVEVIVAIGLSTGGSLSHSATVTRSFGSPESIGRLFLTDQLLAFEVTSIVLLVAAVGGVVLGSHARATEPSRRQPSRRGRGGRLADRLGGRCTGLTSPGTSSWRACCSRPARSACSSAGAR